MSELESLPEKVASSIPYFFYDLFGRIFPVLFLLCGLFIASRHTNLFQEFLGRAEKARTAEWVIGSVILTAACFVTGFLLSMVSRGLWLFRIPVSLADLRDQFGSSTTAESPLEVAFKANFGFSLDHKSQTRAYLAYCSRLCQLAVARFEAPSSIRETPPKRATTRIYRFPTFSRTRASRISAGTLE